MLRWVAASYVIAILAMVFGFAGISAGVATTATLLLVVFLFLFSPILGRRRDRHLLQGRCGVLPGSDGRPESSTSRRGGEETA